MEYALALQGSSPAYEKSSDTTFNQVIGLLGNEDTGFIESVRELVRSGGRQELELKLLSAGTVSTKLKHILVAGMYRTEPQGEVVRQGKEGARETGATEEAGGEGGVSGGGGGGSARGGGGRE